MDILDQRVKFITDILNKVIVLNRKTDLEVHNLLKKLNYLELAPNVDSDKKSYDYLTGMALKSLTEERINDLMKEHENKTVEYNDYVSTTVIDMWKREINEFIEAYQKWSDESDEGTEEGAKKKQSSQENQKVKRKRLKIDNLFIQTLV